ncbi:MULTISPECIES: 5-formyltetrahydrofolate cyclo-ligase [unclassified Methanoculleus]|uniref:5-formyltetrahydrofolate cyclo-ligase n=1 Tax=unclassified Methanoculleus TaxID=2619537 RepID=UPI0025CF51A4|nr:MULTISPECIES: 5-formyltetrahydrofolate cyclo-ligase [unclassified Methanoculleus]MCK9317341.1 5-formyltetrahydrofolate cyclo-ligase [Methanoculleus sp.]MDD2253043.1 5-formyltetrahydrofolate cyclo-ligase [Methanoculleus sp.]MDD2786639.1 5-formyltetrahydrofolate cyclo-ligase [Methanoculleus sp.]MDD3216226.1 5-formyltetrahydrofolate cyclo-ligase [Methanoculleus sp.]MDD4313889.1 5-formyltetrahydrofolate cyclo-ligase [Methanoculleus sp.]
MSQTKAALREQAKEARLLLSPSQITEYSRSITERLLDLLNGCTTVMVYVAKAPEVETSGLIADLNRRGVRVVVPIIERETCSLRLSYLPDPAALSPSTFNVPEPIGHELPARPEEIEVVIIPMLAFDAEGNRLGYGAGYYDRFLSRYPHPQKIGIAFSCQQTPSVPVDENDVKMDWIVTEKGTTRLNGSSMSETFK